MSNIFQNIFSENNLLTKRKVSSLLEIPNGVRRWNRQLLHAIPTTFFSSFFFFKQGESQTDLITRLFFFIICKKNFPDRRWLFAILFFFIVQNNDTSSYVAGFQLILVEVLFISLSTIKKYVHLHSCLILCVYKSVLYA